MSRALYPALLAAIIFALYSHALNYPLVFDDTGFFFEETLRQYGSSTFNFNLRWFPYASFGWTYYLAGTDWFWYRLGNVALHALTSWPETVGVVAFLAYPFVAGENSAFGR